MRWPVRQCVVRMVMAALGLMVMFVLKRGANEIVPLAEPYGGCIAARAAEKQTAFLHVA